MIKTVLSFSGIAIGILVIFLLSKYSIFSGHIGIEFVLITIAIIFLILGMYLSKRKKGTTTQVPIKNLREQLKAYKISDREYEILQKIAEGYSNREIGEQLFISENTIKTHVSSLFQKLNVKRRTQAIQKAKELQIL